MIEFNKDVCINVGRSLDLEWLDVNGAGGYASSSILGCHTRRYHGLLVARLADPPGKYVLLSSIEESLLLDDRELFLGVHKYPGVVFPRGHRYLRRFELGALPRFFYRAGRTQLRREVAMPQGENAVLIRYRVRSGRTGARLRARPLLAYRDFHALARENVYLRPRSFPARDGFSVRPYDGMPPLFVQVAGDFEYLPTPTWYRDFEYPAEQRRGFDFREDLFCPGSLEIELPADGEVIICASTVERYDDLRELWRREQGRRRRLLSGLRGTALQRRLKWSARQFLSADDRGRTGITAGFPWFLEWGRDAMIAAPGIGLALGDPDAIAEVLETFVAHRRDGTIPNFIAADPQHSAYNSADASLWLAFAVQQFLQQGGDPRRVGRSFYEVLVEIMRAYRDGRSPVARRNADGLIETGGERENSTWMDAMIDGRPVTPRSGCPVELQALWYNLLRFVERLAEEISDPAVASEARDAAEGFSDLFARCFWIEEEGRLGDVYSEGRLDRSMRPNQIFAASLPFSPLSDDRALAMLERVRAELVTPFGLRTLSPRDAGFCGHYRGGPAERDGAYHNGTVWPWLFGHFAEAWLKRTRELRLAVEKLEGYLARFEEHLERVGLGSISEVFDGDPPPRPGGCPFQAWSAAEVLRVSLLVEQARARLDAEEE
ncbi:MAG: amylo-alpha-1,6-glucosidase [Polyangia bacterium]